MSLPGIVAASATVFEFTATGSVSGLPASGAISVVGTVSVTGGPSPTSVPFAYTITPAATPFSVTTTSASHSSVANRIEVTGAATPLAGVTNVGFRWRHENSSVWNYLNVHTGSANVTSPFSATITVTGSWPSGRVEVEAFADHDGNRIYAGDSRFVSRVSGGWSTTEWIHLEPLSLHHSSTTVRVHAWGWPNIPHGWHGGTWPHWSSGSFGNINVVGVEVATNPSFSGSWTVTQSGHSGTVTFNTAFNRVYYVRGYVVTPNGTFWGPTHSLRGGVSWLGAWNRWNNWNNWNRPSTPGHWGWWSYGQWTGANRDRQFINTNQPTEVTAITAVVSANIPNRGWTGGWAPVDQRVIERGFVWSSTNRMPTVQNSVVREQTSQIGTFNQTLTGLTPNTTYFVSAFYRTPQRIFYGNVVELRTTNRVTTPGAPVTVNAQFRTMAGVEQGTAELQTVIGATITPANFTVPAGYSIWPPNWTYVVTGEASIMVMLSPSGQTPPGLGGTPPGTGPIMAGEFMPGRGAFNFAPDASISRGELAQAIFNLSGGQATGQPAQFTDAAHSPFAQAISFVASSGLMRGYEDGSFRPGGQLSRAEAATVLARMHGLTGTGGTQFFDMQGHWAANYVALAADRGIINGYGDGTFGPNRPLTRAEATALLVRASNRGVQPIQAQRFQDVPEWHWAFQYIMSAAVPRQ